MKDDVISRQAAIDAVYKCTDIFINNLPVMVDKADAYKALADLPSVQPYTEEEIQRMQDMEQAQLDKAFELGREDAKPKWIPVTERLPDKPDAYLVTWYNDGISLYYYDGNWFSNEYWKSYITAWMPSPEPYRKEGEKR